MKKLFFIAIAATGLLFSCNNNDNESTTNVNNDDPTTVTATSDVAPVATKPIDSLIAPELVPEEPKL